MTAPDRSSTLSAARLAASIGVASDDIDAVGEIFSQLTSGIGLDGRKVFAALRKGETLATALAIPSQTAPLLYARAHNLFSVGRADKAAVLFRALCALAEEVPDYWIGYGICLKKMQRPAEAEVALVKGSSLRPDWALPYFHLAEAYLRTGDQVRARAALDSFFARESEDTPDSLTVEAERYRAVLAAREQIAEVATAGTKA